MFNRGGFHGQRPMGHSMMNQPGMNHLGMNMSGMNMPGMNMAGMNMPAMNQPNMNLSGMNNPGMNHPRMGHPGMNNPNMGFSGMNQPGMNQPNMNQPGMNQPTMGLNRMNLPAMNQGGMNQGGMNQGGMNQGGMNQGAMGFRPEMKSQGFGMRPMDGPGSFGGGNPEAMGMKSMPVRSPMQSAERHMGPQAVPQRFSGPNLPSRQGQPRMQSQSQEIPSIVNRVLTHSSDHLVGKPKIPAQEPAQLNKEKPWDALNLFGNMGQDVGMKSNPVSTQKQTPNPQNHYTNESASSILQSFGLSNEDLEELSRYPDDQLTTGNMPSILRDIRLRKMSRPGSTPDQGGGRRPGSVMVPSKVIDYGHSSKFKYNYDPASKQSYDSPRTEPKSKPVSKEPAASTNKKPEKTPENSSDNKIPTISGSRKPTWQSSKPNRSNNKTLVGEQNIVTTSAVNVSQVKSPVVSIKTDGPVLTEAAVPVHTDAKPEVPVATGVGNVNYQLPPETTPAGKGTWLPALSQEDAQKMKRLPTPSMMNDYYAASPRIFPHICSLCNVECRHLKDWITHQNNTSHIENCRKLRQQYPDWNPQVLSSLRNEGKDDPSKRSKSRSTSPRRSRRSTSRRRTRTSLSRSPRSSVRTRSRSPRRSRLSPRRTRSPRRSISPRRPRRGHSRTSSASPDKKAVDAAVQSFIEASKIKSGEKPKFAKAASSGKKLPPKPSIANVKPKKPTASSAPTKRSGSSSVKPPSSSTSSASSSSRKPSGGVVTSAARKPSSDSATTKKSTSSTAAVKKPIVSTAAKKTTSSSASYRKGPTCSLRKASNPPKASPKSPVAEAHNPLNKFPNKNNAGNVIHVTNLPDSGYTDQDILKIVQPFGKVCDVLIVRSKNEAFIETNFKEAATAAVNFSETTPVMINQQRVTLSLVGQKKPVKKELKSFKAPVTPAKPSSQIAKKDKEKPLKEPAKKIEELPPGFVKRYKLADPPMKDAEKCIILVSNLPETKFTVDEISNLAKPFGGVNDILILPTHRKAYLELASKSSVESMIKFYSVFSTYLGGNLLTISNVARYKDLKDQDRIFADLIEQTPYKITPTIYEKFVYLLNLPEKDVSEYDVACIGVRFGKVEHYVIFSNKRKAIVHMQSASAAKAMHSFLTKHPCIIQETTVQCALPSKTQLAEDEYITILEEDKASPDTKSSDETEVVTTTEETNPQITDKKPASSCPVKEDTAASLPTSPISQTEMEIDVPQNKKAEAPPPTVPEQSDIDSRSKADPRTVEGPPPIPSAPTQSASSCGTSSSEDLAVQAAEDDDDYEEEAAEAPEAPDASPIYIHPEPMIQFKEPSPVSQLLLPEELEVLVSVESDEEECEEQSYSFLNAKPVNSSVCVHQPAVVPSEDNKEPVVVDKKGSGNEDTNDVADRGSTVASQNVSSKPPDRSILEPKPESVLCTLTEDGYNKPETCSVAQQPTDKISGLSSESPQGVEANACITDTQPEGKVETSATEAEENNATEAKADSIVAHSPSEERSKQPAQTKSTDESVSGAGEASKETDSVSVTSGISLTRTAKYNPRKGELSVTLSVDSQKSIVKTGDGGRKRSSGHESFTPKSYSNRSSPTDSASSNPKSRTECSLKKNGGKHVSSQQERDLKSTSRSRERDARTSTRKDDRSKGNSSSSSRYTRSSKTSVRCFRPKTEDDESFPFNLDEFVTVDEIVEEHRDPKSREAGEAARKGKRKENDPVPSDTKKSRGLTVDPRRLSFVTLDEVGDEDDNMVSEPTTNPTSRSVVTVDEVHGKDGAARSGKDSQMLMTLDEISDEEDAQDSAAGPRTSVIPEILAKDQLLTLDEISGEDEEQTSPSEQLIVAATLLKDTPLKVEDSCEEPNVEGVPVDLEVFQADSTQGDQTKEHLLTLDEVKEEEDEEEFLAGIENSFLTVDEVGEDEEDSELKVEKAEKPKASPSGNRKSSKSAEPSISPAPAARRGRPRKRPLSTEANKQSSQQTTPETTKVTEPDKTPIKSKSSKGNQGTVEGSTPEKPASADGKSNDAETSAKKKKLASPDTATTKLAPFSPSVPIGMEFLVTKTGYFCELCSLFYMDDASKLKHCRSLKHYQAVEKHMAQEQGASAGKSSS